MKFMKIFANQLINEKVTLIREACMDNVILFLSYLRAEDIDKISILLFDLFVKKIQETTDIQTI